MKPSFLLALDGDQWHVARVAGVRVELEDLAAGEGAPGDIKAVLDRWGYRRQGVCLGLPSDMVFSAQIDCDALAGKQRRSAMLYRLEEQLPLDIERLTADFLPPAGGRALGVAVETARVREIVEQLSGAGIETVAICPTALLALWNLRRNCSQDNYAIVASSGKMNLFRMHDRQPVSWFTVDGSDEDLIRCIQADRLAHPFDAEQTTTCVIADPGWPPAALASTLGFRVERAEEVLAAAVAARAAERMLAGDGAGWVNLRRAGLALADPWGPLRGLVRSAVTLGLLLLVAVTAAFCWRGLEYAAKADRILRQQDEVYGRLYPNRAAPSGVKSRLRSELRRLAGLGGVSSEAPRQASALDTLRSITANLPPGVRARILELRISPEGIFIEGQTRMHGDAESIKRGLETGGIEMDPPHTEIFPGGGVSFTLTGKVKSEEGASRGEAAKP